MNSKLYIYQAIYLVALLCLSSCEDFVEVEAPNNKLVREEVFSSDDTARSAMTGIYNQLFMAGYANGSSRSITFLPALSADNIKNIVTTDLNRIQFEEHEITPDNQYNLVLWSSAYNIIYLTNAFIEGVSESENISDELKKELEGEARFIRAFTYFHLTNLYGEVPLLLTSDYQNNELAGRTSQQEVYEQVFDDLQISIDLLNEEYADEERTQVTSNVAKAFLARVYLYVEDWEMAEYYSNEVISNSTDYEVLEDLDKVFLANSQEAIWQLSPIARGGNTQTNEGNLFIHSELLPFFVSNALKSEFLEVFDETDKRLTSWVGFNDFLGEHYVYKYKIWNSNEFPIAEYSMVLRLAEQYLIRAEARAQQDNIAGAINDIDVIRGRAGTDLIADINPTINRDEILQLIMEERRKELFAEWGHRWFDLKRTGIAEEELGNDNALWQNTDVLYPIPSDERMKNPNLTQNTGY